MQVLYHSVCPLWKTHRAARTQCNSRPSIMENGDLPGAGMVHHVPPGCTAPPSRIAISEKLRSFTMYTIAPEPCMQSVHYGPLCTSTPSLRRQAVRGPSAPFVSAGTGNKATRNKLRKRPQFITVSSPGNTPACLEFRAGIAYNLGVIYGSAFPGARKILTRSRPAPADNIPATGIT